jgi:hypothetical protein
MANIKLGAIITDIAGSIGGTTFRRTPAGIIAYNKQGTQIKSAFAKNSVKNKLGAILGSWNFLETAVKDFWIDKATLYTFPGKFGTLKNLTGRQLYTKLNSQFIPTNEVLTTTPFYDELYSGICYQVNASFGSEEILLDFDVEIVDYWVLCQIYPLRKGGNSKPSKKSYNTYVDFITGKTQLNLFGAFVQQYPTAQPSTDWGVNIITMTQSGFQTSVQSFAFRLGI